MKTLLIDGFISLTEIVCEILLSKSLLKVKFKDLSHPALFSLLYVVTYEILKLIFPNLFGWFLFFPLAIITQKLIFKLDFAKAFFVYLMSYTLSFLIQLLTVIAVPTTALDFSDTSQKLLGTSSTLILAFIVSMLPLNKLYLLLHNSNILIKLIFYYFVLISITMIVLSKIKTLNTHSFLPVFAIFVFGLLIISIYTLKLQQTVDIQKESLRLHSTYEPMTRELINDIRNKQHEFNNQITAFASLPYTHKDYDSLSKAILSYTQHTNEDYEESQLLRINLPILAGFIFSKIKQAMQQDKTINLTIKNNMLQTTMPEYDLVKALGILIDNAVEAAPQKSTIEMSLDSVDNRVIFSISNQFNFVTAELRKKMLTRGYSTKNPDIAKGQRGQGLPNLLDLVEAYDGKVYIENVEVSGNNHVKFEIIV